MFLCFIRTDLLATIEEITHAYKIFYLLLQFFFLTGISRGAFIIFNIKKMISLMA